MLQDGGLATNSVVTLEVLYSAQNALDFRRLRKQMSALHDLGLSAAAQQRALELQARLATKSQHRIPITDILIAADAECNGLELIHYDAHFDLIAEFSDLKARWIVPRGTAH